MYPYHGVDLIIYPYQRIGPGMYSYHGFDLIMYPYHGVDRIMYPYPKELARTCIQNEGIGPEHVSKSRSWLVHIYYIFA